MRGSGGCGDVLQQSPAQPYLPQWSSPAEPAVLALTQAQQGDPPGARVVLTAPNIPGN